MSVPLPRRQRIVVALDDSDYGEIVLEHALDQAVRGDRPDLHFIAVVADRDEAESAMDRLAAQVAEGIDTQNGVWRTRLHVRIGDPAEEIAALASEIAADLLVIGRFGTHSTRKAASTADRVLELCACPTLVVRLGEHVVEAEPQCPDCVVVREDSDGERWFCAAHSSPDRLELTARLPSSWSSIQGGPLW